MRPSEYLDAPFPSLPMPDALNQAIHWTDFLSPTHDVLLVIEKAVGHNPFKEISTGLSGDWEAFGVCQTAVQQLGEYFGAVAVEIGHVADRLDPHWDGNAGAAAVTSFATNANTVQGAVSPLGDIAKQLGQIAVTVNQSASLMVTIEEKICDAAFLAALEAAGAALTVETIIGAIGLGAAAAAEVAEIVDLVGDLAKAWDTMMLAIDLLLTGVLSSVADLESTVTAPLQLTAYHHPGVTS